MSDLPWLAAVRCALADHPAPEVQWSDVDLERYFLEGFTPESAAAELAFRDLARR